MAGITFQPGDVAYINPDLVPSSVFSEGSGPPGPMLVNMVRTDEGVQMVECFWFVQSAVFSHVFNAVLLVKGHVSKLATEVPNLQREDVGYKISD